MARSRRRALPAGVDLAGRRLRPAVRARPRPPGARREHAVLPVEPGRPPPDRRGAARRTPDRGGPRPGRSGLLQLDAPVVRRARAGARLRGRVRPAGRAGPGRLGAVLALPRARDVRRAARPPLRARRPVAGAGDALPRHRRRPARPRSTAPAASSASTTGTVGTIPRDNARSYVEPGWRPTVLGPVVRTGARLGQFAPPRLWRRRACRWWPGSAAARKYAARG